MTLSRRDFLKGTVLLAGSGALTACATEEQPPHKSGPESEPFWTPTTVNTEIPKPTTTSEMVNFLTEEIWTETIQNRTNFWSGIPGEEIYKLAHYSDLPNDKIERGITLEPLINHRTLHIFIGGFDGKEGRTKDWSQMNCDAPISIFLDLDSGSITAIPWERDMPLGRGIDHTSDGDIFSRLGHTQSSESDRSKYLVLDAVTPEDNIKNNLAILTGSPPDYMINMNMDAVIWLFDVISKISPSKSINPEQELVEIRDRKDKSSGLRGKTAIQGAIKLAKILLNDGLSLETILSTVQLGMDATTLSGDTMIGNTGNILSKIAKSLNKLNLNVDQQKALIDEIFNNIIYLCFVPSTIEPEIVKSGASYYYSENTLRKVVKDVIDGRTRNLKDPNDHNYPILFHAKSRSGHGVYHPMEMYFENGLYGYSEKQNQGVATITTGVSLSEYNYEKVLTNPEELTKLRRYHSIIRQIMNRYIEPPSIISSNITRVVYQLFFADTENSLL